MAKGFSISLTTESVNKTIRSLRDFDAAVQRTVWTAMIEAGQMIERDAKSKLNAQTSQMATSRLGSSLRTNFNKREFWVENWTNVEYAPFVEFGTGTKVSVPAGYEAFAMQFKRGPGVNLPARPYLIPAFEYHGSRFQQAVEKILERETKR